MKRPALLASICACLLLSGCLVGAFGEASDNLILWAVGIGSILVTGVVVDALWASKPEASEETRARLSRNVDEAFDRATTALAAQQPVGALNEEFRRAQEEWKRRDGEDSGARRD